jgi:multidrug efflux system membrane fusion protein
VSSWLQVVKQACVSSTENGDCVIAWLVLLAWGCSVLAACSKGPAEEKEPPAPVPVEAVQVVQKNTPLFLDAIGTVKAYNTVDIRSRVTGELRRTLFKEGDKLTHGQDLFVIDPDPFLAKVKEATARLKQSSARYDQSKKDFHRFNKLYKEKAVSDEKLEQKEVEMKSQLYQVELDQTELDAAKLKLSYCYIHSPLHGQSGQIFVDDHNIVIANTDKLVTIKQIKPIKVSLSMPGKHLRLIKEYHARGPLELQAVPLGSNMTEDGFLTMINNYVNPRTGMILLEGTFPNEKARLWPGQFVKVRMKLTVTRNAVLVPHRAVNEGPNGKFVWIIGDDQTVQIRPVKIERRYGEMDVVAKGLQPGQEVVTDGRLTLKTGAKVVKRAPSEAH